MPCAAQPTIVWRHVTRVATAQAAIFSQLSAQRRQASTHSAMSPSASQLSAQARQISADSLQT